MKDRFLNSIANDRNSPFLKNEIRPVKEKPKYTIPDKYLPLEKRTVQPGIAGLKEKLRRD